MARPVLWLLLSLVWAGLGSGIGAVRADEVQIYDNLKLLRAVKVISGPVEVVAKIGMENSQNGIGFSGKVSMVDENGVLPDIAGLLKAPGEYGFERVSRGNWRIVPADSQAVVLEVEVHSGP